MLLSQDCHLVGGAGKRGLQAGGDPRAVSLLSPALPKGLFKGKWDPEKSTSGNLTLYLPIGPGSALPDCEFHGTEGWQQSISPREGFALLVPLFNDPTQRAESVWLLTLTGDRPLLSAQAYGAPKWGHLALWKDTWCGRVLCSSHWSCSLNH